MRVALRTILHISKDSSHNKDEDEEVSISWSFISCEFLRAFHRLIKIKRGSTTTANADLIFD